MKTTFNWALLPLVCCLILAAPVFVTSAMAVPMQDEKSELEQMILKRIEERKKEIEAEKAAAAKSGTNNSSPQRFGKSPSGTTGSPSQNAVQTPTASPAQATPRNNFNAATTTADAPAEGTAEATPMGIPRADAPEREAEFTEPTQMPGSTKSEIDPNTRIRFNFTDEEWKDVIEWFADQIGFGVYYGQTGPPQGTFTYFDSSERTVIEALDFLNSRLSVLQPSHVLVRNGNQLVLVNESLAYPEPLIALVTPDQLQDYGQFEVVSCQFDLGRLTTGNALALELREDVSQIHIDGFTYYQAANRLHIRERVRVLERLKDIIDFALKQDERIGVDSYRVQHVEAESLLINLRPLMGFVGEANMLEDGSLSISVQPFGDTIYIKGSPSRIDEFKKTAALIDVPPTTDGAMTEEPYFQAHRVTGGDPAIIFQVLQTLLDGEPNVMMDQDANNGTIYLRTPKRVHDIVTDFLGNLSGDASFDIIRLKNLTPTEAVDKLEDLLDLGNFDQEATGPKLLADKDTDSIFVNGTPQEIVKVRNMVERMDAEATSTTGVRRPVIMIPMSPRKQEDIMNLMQIPGIMDSIGRKNRLNLILPEDREKFRNRIRFDRMGSDRGQTPMAPMNGESGTVDGEDSDFIPDPRSVPESGSDEGLEETRFQDDRRFESTRIGNGRGVYYVNAPRQESEPQVRGPQVREPQPVSTARLSPQESEDLGKTTAESAPDPGSESEYQSAAEEPSIAGAPIEIRMTEQGLMINTRDLDAGADLESMISDWVGAESESQLPSFFYLQYRKVDEAKSILEHVLGLESSSGGGGGGALGGLGGLLGGAVQNAVGGAAGDALGGLLGGGDSGFSDDSAGAIELEGEDVKLGTDVRFNTLIVSGATDNDIDVIGELIDYVDQPGPPQRPRLLGETYAIKVMHRDPVELKEKIESQLPDYFNKQSGGGGNQDPQQQVQQAVAKQLQQALQGNGKGKGGGNSEAEEPKATLGVDEANSMLLVTGPHFIYEAVYHLVKAMDIESPNKPFSFNAGPFSSSALKQLLMDAFGDKIYEADEDEDSSGGAASGGTPGRTTTPQPRPNQGRGGRNSSPSIPNQNSNSAIQEAILNQIRSGGNRQGGQGGGRFPNAGGGGGGQFQGFGNNGNR